MTPDSLLLALFFTAGALLAELAGRARLAGARREAVRIRRRTDRAIELEAAEQERRSAVERASRQQESDRHLAVGRRDLVERVSSLDSRAAELDRRGEGFALQQAEASEVERQLAERLRHLDRVRARLDARRAQVDRALLVRAGRPDAELRAEASRRAGRVVADEVERVRVRRLERVAAEVDHAARSALAVAIGRSQVSHAHPHHTAIVHLMRGDPPELAPGVDIEAARAQVASLLEVELRHDPEQQVLFAVHPDGVVREVARRSIERVLDERLRDPGEIELRVIAQMDAIDADLDGAGRRALAVLGLEPPAPGPSRAPRELIRTLGRLQFRTSYGQNILHHSVEVAVLCALLAAELGLDNGLARGAGLYHDLGKALDKGTTEGHPELGARVLAQHGAPREVIEAARDHHLDPSRQPLYAALVCAADTISAARPGARRESFEQYVKRLERLEMIAHGVFGVDTAFAVQAGRELRVLVNPDDVDDARAVEIARLIAKQIREQLDFPGKVCVTVIREKRVVEYAR